MAGTPVKTARRQAAAAAAVGLAPEVAVNGAHAPAPPPKASAPRGAYAGRRFIGWPAGSGLLGSAARAPSMPTGAAPPVPPALDAQPSPAPAPDAPDADRANAWRSWATNRDAQAPAVAGLQVDQMLVSHWNHVIMQSGVPASACMITLRCTDPAPGYDFQITGEQCLVTVSGHRNPGLALQEQVGRNRRRPDQWERFFGKIQGYGQNGGIVDLGGGDMQLAPEVRGAPGPAVAWGPAAQAAPSPWGAPPSALQPPPLPPPPYPYPYGYPYPPMPPGYGVQPPQGPVWPPGAPAGQMGYPYAMPPHGYPPQPPIIVQPPPPPAVPTSGDPNAVKTFEIQANMWAAQMKNQTDMMGMVMRAQPQPAPATSPTDNMSFIKDVIGMAKDLADINRPAAKSGPTIEVSKIDDETTLISQNGKIDSTLTGVVMAKDTLKSIVKGLNNRAQARSAIQGAAQAPKAPGT